MVNWSCASALCFNNYKSKDANEQLLKYYRFPRSESIHEVVYDKWDELGKRAHVWSPL